jgi:hypothetical protein
MRTVRGGEGPMLNFLAIHKKFSVFSVVKFGRIPNRAGGRGEREI